MNSDHLKVFISYTSVDLKWAEWIAWQIEEVGHKAVIQAWDFVPGSNFVVEMDRAAANADRTLAVLSQAYLDKIYTHSEWAAAFAQDPKGEKRVLVPVRVEECELNGRLLGQVVYVDLVRVSEAKAREEILKALTGKRRKPASRPVFPGKRPIFPGAELPYLRTPSDDSMTNADDSMTNGATSDEVLHALSRYITQKGKVELRNQSLAWHLMKIVPMTALLLTMVVYLFPEGLSEGWSTIQFLAGLWLSTFAVVCILFCAKMHTDQCIGRCGIYKLLLRIRSVESTLTAMVDDKCIPISKEDAEAIIRTYEVTSQCLETEMP